MRESYGTPQFFVWRYLPKMVEVLCDRFENSKRCAACWFPPPSEHGPIATNCRRIASAFRRLPDKYLRLPKRGTSTESAFFEALANFKTNPSGAESLKNDLINLLRAMDADGRQILRWKLQGYSDSEIANRLGSTPSAVRTRFTRSLNQAAQSILPDDRI